MSLYLWDLNTENILFFLSGFNILRCGNRCRSVGPRKGEDVVAGAHYHCFGCANLFTRVDRAIKHYATHANLPNIEIHSHTAEVMAEPEPIAHNQSNTTTHTHVTMALPNIAPNSSNSLRGNNIERVRCQYCEKSFHPHSLKTHIDTQHNTGASHLVISPYRFHKGICVDANNGVYFLRRNLSGPCNPVHVQYCPNGNPPKVMCQLTECQQVMDTAARSGDVGFLCKHLLSVQYIPTELPSVRPLGSNSLDYLVNGVNLLKAGSKVDCLEYQLSAIQEGVPLIVPLPPNDDPPSQLSFSVWVKERKHWWSFCNRVCVTFDCEQRLWYCKHVKGVQSCIHKTIVKWYMAEHMPHLLQFTQPPSTDDMDEAEVVPFQATDIVIDEEEETSQYSAPQLASTYPPTGDMLKKATQYLLDQKTIPVNLPANLVRQVISFPKK